MAPLAPLAPSTDIREIFDRIAPKYDRFNALASLGRHQGWRMTLVRQIPVGAQVLDIATGTGDVAFRAQAQGHEVVGLDFSEAMIAAALRKDVKRSIEWVTGSAEVLPFADSRFGCVTSAFALRNFRSGLDAVFREAFRVLKVGGKTLHLDFGRPAAPWMRLGHRAYLMWGMPVVGRWVCGQRWPQNYLKDTINTFFEPAEIEDRLETAGFTNVSHQPIMGGVVQLYRGTKAC